MTNMAPHGAALSAAVRASMRTEFTNFFVEMLKEEPQWPSISDSEFIGGLADSLVEMGKRSSRGNAILQTLVYELQERLENQP